MYISILLHNFVVIFVTLISVIMPLSYLPTFICTFWFFFISHSCNKAFIYYVPYTYFIILLALILFLNQGIEFYLGERVTYVDALLLLFNLQLPILSVAFFITNFSSSSLAFLYFFLQVSAISFLLDINSHCGIPAVGNCKAINP